MYELNLSNQKNPEYSNFANHNNVLYIVHIHICLLVFWQLGQEVIELGKPLILQCTIMDIDYIPKDKSRQWTGEFNNRLFTFNGVSTCPSNYTEILEPPKTFKIYFNTTSMNNLNCPYSCRVGTVFDEKVLTLNESNFVCK